MDKEEERMVGVTLPESLIEAIQAEARREVRSLSGQIRFILKEHFDGRNGYEKDQG